MPLSAGACLYVKGLGLDLHEDASRDDKAVEGFNRAGGGLEDVDHTLVRAHLELLARLLINVRAAENRVPLDAGGDGDGAAHAGVRPLGVVDDFLRRRVKRPVVVGFHPNSNPIASHLIPSCCIRTVGREPTTSPPRPGGASGEM